MLSKNYRECSITQAGLRFLIQFASNSKVSIQDASFFAGCQNWIDRQQARLALQKVSQGK